MTKILHTADLHLKEYGDERWKAMEEILETGKREGVDLLAVSGDLFDQETDAQKLRDRVREVFSGSGFRIILLPGNHDSASYAGGLYFGEDVVILGEPFSRVETEDTVIWGLPFEPLDKREVISRLQTLSHKLDAGRTNLLLYHGELLDAFFSRKDLGDEGDYSYMPASLSYFAEAGLDYVLAGHFHTSFRVWPLPGGTGSFIYPGSPVSVTSREKGRRKVNLLEPGTGAPPQEISLETFHYEEIVVKLDPFIFKPLGSDGGGFHKQVDPVDPIETISHRLSGLHSAARATLRVTGYFHGANLGLTESQLVEKIQEVISRELASSDPGRVQLQAEFKDIRTILEDPLARSFLEKLEHEDCPEETKIRSRDLALQAMMEVRG